MNTAELRRRIKREIDRLSSAHLALVVEYVAVLKGRTSLAVRVRDAEAAIAAGGGVNWRTVRDP